MNLLPKKKYFLTLNQEPFDLEGWALCHLLLIAKKKRNILVLLHSKFEINEFIESWLR